MVTSAFAQLLSSDPGSATQPLLNTMATVIIEAPLYNAAQDSDVQLGSSSKAPQSATFLTSDKRSRLRSTGGPLVERGSATGIRLYFSGLSQRELSPNSAT